MMPFNDGPTDDEYVSESPMVVFEEQPKLNDEPSHLASEFQSCLLEK